MEWKVTFSRGNVVVWKEAVVAYVKILVLRPVGSNEENHENIRENCYPGTD
jgi:hypothetical protein